MAAHDTDLIDDLIEYLSEIGDRKSDGFVEHLTRFREDILLRNASGEEFYARGLQQGEARAWNAMRNFVAMRGDDARLTSADLMDRLGDKLASVSGDPESALKNVDDIARVLTRKVMEQFK